MEILGITRLATTHESESRRFGAVALGSKDWG